jgi:ketosteroid isomerase-like protein
MSTEANIALIQAAYADFQKGDIPSLLARLTDDVVWTTPYPPDIVPHGGTRKGKAGVVQFFQQLAGGIEFTKFDPREFIASGDRVVALVSIAGITKSTGLASAEEAAHLFRVRDGKVSEFVEYGDTLAVAASYAPKEFGARSLSPARG